MLTVQPVSHDSPPKCSICGKGAHFGNAVSHSHRKTNKMWKSNVKSVKVKTEGGAKKMYVVSKMSTFTANTTFSHNSTSLV